MLDPQRTYYISPERRDLSQFLLDWCANHAVFYSIGKYLFRAGRKPGVPKVDDLRKCLHWLRYLDSGFYSVCSTLARKYVQAEHIPHELLYHFPLSEDLERVFANLTDVLANPVTSLRDRTGYNRCREKLHESICILETIINKLENELQPEQ